MEHKTMMAQSLRAGIGAIQKYRIRAVTEKEFLYLPWLSTMFRVSGDELDAETYERFAMARREACESRNDWSANVLRARLKMQLRQQEAA